MSFAKSNSGSKKTSEVNIYNRNSLKESMSRAVSSIQMSQFIPGTDIVAPDAIHVDLKDMDY